ncbi:MAG: thioredoxin-dependent thiol peroxidase [Chloroflexota bacterium]|jgi:peroxiredoxin Q/BCP|nr:thioredoxin-dependent thiol peroxidase [Aggregatilineaceae bacterium]
MPAVGEKAPDFELKNQDGETVRLSDYRGQKVVLFAFPKAGTSGCTAQACGLRDAFPRLEAANAVVLGLSPDQPADLKKWQQEESLPYDLLSDPDHRVLEEWGVWGEKSMYGKTYMGVIRSHWIIDENGAIADAQVKVSPAESVERATQFLAASA